VFLATNETSRRSNNRREKNRT